MKKRLPVLIAVIAVLCLLIAMAAPVYAWGESWATATADDTASPGSPTACG